MTVLENSVRINASPEKVWSVLASLDALDQYDPGIQKSEIVSPLKQGLGSARKCEFAGAKGWFKEKVAEWRPHESLSFELYECTLPLRSLKHRYTLTTESGATVVHQRMEYVLKFGPLGKVMDAVMVRKKWDVGIKDFFVGLKGYVETGKRPPGKG